MIKQFQHSVSILSFPMSQTSYFLLLFYSTGTFFRSQRYFKHNSKIYFWHEPTAVKASKKKNSISRVIVFKFIVSCRSDAYGNSMPRQGIETIPRLSSPYPRTIQVIIVVISLGRITGQNWSRKKDRKKNSKKQFFL